MKALKEMNGSAKWFFLVIGLFVSALVYIWTTHVQATNEADIRIGGKADAAYEVGKANSTAIASLDTQYKLMNLKMNLLLQLNGVSPSRIKALEQGNE